VKTLARILSSKPGDPAVTRAIEMAGRAGVLFRASGTEKPSAHFSTAANIRHVEEKRREQRREQGGVAA